MPQRRRHRGRLRRLLRLLTWHQREPSPVRQDPHRYGRPPRSDLPALCLALRTAAADMAVIHYASCSGVGTGVGGSWLIAVGAAVFELRATSAEGLHRVRLRERDGEPVADPPACASTDNHTFATDDNAADDLAAFEPKPMIASVDDPLPFELTVAAAELEDSASPAAPIPASDCRSASSTNVFIGASPSSHAISRPFTGSARRRGPLLASSKACVHEPQVGGTAGWSRCKSSVRMGVLPCEA